MNKKIGFIIRNLGSSQISYSLIKSLNKIIKQGVSPVVFWEELSGFTLSPHFPSMHVVDAYGYFDPIIATSLDSALTLINLPAPTRKFYYIWDLQWMNYNNDLPWGFYNRLFTNQSLELISRNKAHAGLIESCFNVKINHIFDNFSTKDLLKLL